MASNADQNLLLSMAHYYAIAFAQFQVSLAETDSYGTSRSLTKSRRQSSAIILGSTSGTLTHSQTAIQYPAEKTGVTHTLVQWASHSAAAVASSASRQASPSQA